MSQQYKYTVCIHCMTYNHRPYILDALHGFVMQQTDFPFVAIVMDDASTDGEPEVLSQYISEQCDAALLTKSETDLYELIEVNAKDNPNCHFAFYFLKENQFRTGKKKPIIAEWDAQAKYIALCEGDDYWIDPLKLQKQVDFLDNHLDYSLCFHAAEIQCEDNDLIHSLHCIECEVVEDREYESTELFVHWIVPCASMFYRSKIYDVKTLHSDWLTAGDIDLVLKCANQGKVFGFSDIMSKYRVHPYGLTQGKKNKEFLIMRHPYHFRCLYINYQKLDKNAITWAIAESYYTRMRHRGDIIGKISDFFRMWYWNPHVAILKIKNVLTSIH